MQQRQARLALVWSCYWWSHGERNCEGFNGKQTQWHVGVVWWETQGIGHLVAASPTPTSARLAVDSTHRLHSEIDPKSPTISGWICRRLIELCGSRMAVAQ